MGPRGARQGFPVALNTLERGTFLAGRGQGVLWLRPAGEIGRRDAAVWHDPALERGAKANHPFPLGAITIMATSTPTKIAIDSGAGHGPEALARAVVAWLRCVDWSHRRWAGRVHRGHRSERVPA